MPINIIDSEMYIQKVLTIWRNNHLNSEMIITDSDGIKRFDINRARRHYKFIRFCHILFTELNRFEPTITKKKQLTTSAAAKQQQFLSEANELITDLEIKLPIDKIVTDFETVRNIRRTFKGMFKLYGIPLNEKMLQAIFGKYKDPQNPKLEIDAIKQFTLGTSFHKDLRYQFGTTLDMKGTGIFSIFFMRAAGLLGLNGTNYNPIKEEDSKYFKNISPLWSENTVMRILIKAALSTQVN